MECPKGVCLAYRLLQVILDSQIAYVPRFSDLVQI